MSDTTETKPARVRLSSVQDDLTREREGEWIDIPEWPGVKFGVRSLETPAYKIARDIVMQKLIRKAKGKPIDPVVRDREFAKLYAEHILFGWEGFDIDYTQDEAQQMAPQPVWRTFFKQVEWAAGQVGDVEVEFVDESAKN